MLAWSGPVRRRMEEAEKVALRIVKNGPLSVRAIKESVIKCMGLTVEDGLIKESKLGWAVFNSKDAKEGPQAFMEKREPKFVGE
jgi:enoyl-CoA hydratase